MKTVIFNIFVSWFVMLLNLKSLQLWMIFFAHPVIIICNPFCMLICRVQSMTQFSESSDVYSFGVFLLELITGREAASLIPTESRESLAHWVISTDM